MDTDQITALAREYAEECAKGFAPADMPNCLKNEATGILVCNAEDMLKWLLHRYCLVEKERVKEIIKSADNLILARDTTKQNIGIGMKGAIRNIFPEIAREVEG